MRVVLLCQYSRGTCGVWSRVKADADKFVKEGNEVYVFSSDHIKGNKNKAPKIEILDDITIWRFPARKIAGESFMLWSGEWKKELINLKPDLIIAHGYRHPHTTQSLKISKRIGCKCFLVTHAPFVPKNITRSMFSAMMVNIYDKIYGPMTLNGFDKIIAICDWELKYLLEMGVDKDRIDVSKNKSNILFGTTHKFPLGNRDVLFLGRLAPIKDIPTLLKAAELLPEVKFSIVGPFEEGYAVELYELIEKMKLKNVQFYEPVNDIVEKIKIMDEHKIFVLPSIREAMPTALLEAKERNLILIASDNPGNREVLEKYDKGYLFPVGDYRKLAELIKEVNYGKR